jgi:rRNA maturation RNase YbeY
MLQNNLSIRNLSRSRMPTLPLESVKQTILGKSYELSIVYIGKTRAQKLNNIHKQKDYPANVLSFPLAENVGEIFICLACAKSEARTNSLSLQAYTLYLLIHGMLHLNGYQHGGTMDRAEKKLCHKFHIRYPHT